MGCKFALTCPVCSRYRPAGTSVRRLKISKQWVCTPCASSPVGSAGTDFSTASQKPDTYRRKITRS